MVHFLCVNGSQESVMWCHFTHTQADGSSLTNISSSNFMSTLSPECRLVKKKSAKFHFRSFYPSPTLFQVIHPLALWCERKTWLTNTLLLQCKISVKNGQKNRINAIHERGEILRGGPWGCLTLIYFLHSIVCFPKMFSALFSIRWF